MRIFSERFHNLPLSSFLWAFRIHFAAAKGMFLHAAILTMLAHLEPLPDSSLHFRSTWNAPVPPERGTDGSFFLCCQPPAPILTTSSLVLSFPCSVRSSSPTSTFSWPLPLIPLSSLQCSPSKTFQRTPFYSCQSTFQILLAFPFSSSISLLLKNKGYVECSYWCILSDQSFGCI